MKESEVDQAVGAALSIVGSLGLAAEDAVVLQNSNKLTLRVTPCDVLARVAPPAMEGAQHGARFEIDLAQQLAAARSPVGALDPRVAPRVYEQDGFVITLWTYYQPTLEGEIPAADYSAALEHLHAGMRTVDMVTPHFTDRVESAQQLVADRGLTPDLPDADRLLLADTLRTLRQAIEEHGAPEQLLHGEPHPGNLLATQQGPLFIDLETCCRGPIEFDLAHAPDDVADRYPGVDQDLLRDCRILMLAIIIMWRWDRDDQLPHGRELGEEWLGQMRAAIDRRESGTPS